MRDREAIEKDAELKHLGAGIVTGLKTKGEELIVELLLDIRELLQSSDWFTIK